MDTIKITKNEENQRFDRFLRKYLKQTNISLTQIYKYIRKWLITINNQRHSINYNLKNWDNINIPKDIIKQIDYSQLDKEEKLNQIDKNRIKKMIIYEDDYWLALNKPSGISVHPWDKNENNITMVDILKNYIKRNSATFSPMFWYRLDKDTSWILIAGKTYQSLKYLNSLIRQRNVEKIYLTIVAWKVHHNKTIKKKLKKVYDKKMWISKMIISDDGQVATTYIKPLMNKHDKYLWDITLLETKIITWKMHQIRVHLQNIWTPILGDRIYWDKNLNLLLSKKHNVKRQLLHSWKYSFFDWIQDKNISLVCYPPESFNKIFNMDNIFHEKFNTFGSI